MKYRYVGDIHGQIDVMRQALDCDADRVIFVGDLVDSYRRSISEQIECVTLGLSLAGQGRVDVMWANHEWSYIHDSMRCSGYKPETAMHLLPLLNVMRQKFKPFLFEQDILVTHAGLTKRLWDEYNITLDNLQDTLKIWSEDMNSPFFGIGYARGGWAEVGGPLWCDFNHEFTPIEGLSQVFGHTRGNGIRQVGNNWCIDTLENTAPQFLDMEF